MIAIVAHQEDVAGGDVIRSKSSAADYSDVNRVVEAPLEDIRERSEPAIQRRRRRGPEIARPRAQAVGIDRDHRMGAPFVAKLTNVQIDTPSITDRVAEYDHP